MLARPRITRKSLISKLQLQIGKTRIPKILLGTSPFIGGGQFGSRAAFYHSHFYENPKNIVKVILKAVDLGVMGIQVLPYRPVFEALKAVERELKESLTVVGTIGPDDPLDNFHDFQDFNTVALLVHGQLTDERDSRKISELFNRVHAAGYLAGLVTHKPFSTLSWLAKADLNMNVDLIMVPFNRLGMFMDEHPVKVAEVIRRLDKSVIGKKVLAAGYLPPQNALTYAAQSGCIDAVALGVASEEEAEETFTTAVAAFSRRVNV